MAWATLGALALLYTGRTWARNADWRDNLTLGLADVDDADLEITDEGRIFVAADILESKQIFALEARERAPLVRAIYKALETTKDGNLGEGFFLDLLRRGFSEDEARQQLKIAVDWGRYGELFDFDGNTGQFTLDHRHDPVPT